MREPAFLRQNKDKWLEYERSVLTSGADSRTDPDRLARLYVQLIDDLAYARTFYPRSRVVGYLNGLAARTHLLIYRNKQERGKRFVSFWTTELPLILYQNRRYLWLSVIWFLFFFLLGWSATMQNEDFVRMVLGDDYVDMTIRNIENGDPMAVYKGSAELPMFFMIAINNIRVAFLAFAMGILASVGTLYIMMTNGIMLGAFMGFFYSRSLTLESWPVIFIHGTLEISAIVIAGAAGIMMGQRLLFPGTFTRKEALQAGAKDGIKVLAGLTPVFILAAFLESFVTRYTDMPLAAKLAIIILSMAFVVWYYFLLPILVFEKNLTQITHGKLSTV
jgi:uncharacterized membrane protein SpoIIM required for sporulation